ncbi:MMPL family transporter [Dyella solisilvae]|uniref:MMPL family transporter n=1 Tax=Dyella solisilvae TaxID=1920168 RepID=UPI0018F63084|nr:MMPL family transporter [Dyella solisilvae]
MFRAIHKGLVWLVDRSDRHYLVVLLLGALLLLISLYAASHRLSIDTDSDHLFSEKLPWRQQSEAFARQFPQFSDTLTVVVRAPTPEEARIAAQALNEKLRADPTHFRSSTTPGISPFFNRQGLLLLPPKELESTIGSMLQAQPLLGPLATDPTARGLFHGLDLMVEGVRRGMTEDLSSYDAALGNVAHSMEDAISGHASPLSWQALLTPQLVGANGGQEFILIHPVRDFTALQPGRAATDEMLRLANALPEVKSGRVRINYTGSVPLADEEFASLTDRAVPIAVGSSVLLIFWLMLALGSWRLIVPVIITLVAGLIYTFGFAALAVGRLNLVSVAFAVLFVGLAVDFGIQFAVRLRARMFSERNFDDSMHETAHRVVSQIGLAALATSCGFLAFAPTDFTGVAELGIIAGAGMLLALLCTLTLLPALLRLLSKKEPHAEVALPGGAKADAWLQRNRKGVLAAFALIGLAGLWSAITIPFDANPLHTKRSDTEAMRTLTSLMDDPNTNPFTMDILVKDLAATRTIGDRLGKLPEVAQVVSGADFVPAHQDDKLEQIQQASDLMYAVLNPGERQPTPSYADMRAAARDTAEGIASVADKLDAKSPLRRIGKALEQLAKGSDAQMATANQALTQFLPYTLHQLADSLSAERITMENLPDELKRDWFTPDGRVRVQVTPTASAQKTQGLRRFVQAVQQVAPDAAGSAVDTIKAADTILSAFREAAVYATLAIGVVLMLVLRRLRDAGLVLATLLMSALLTALLARIGGLSINFANIIALPLLLGVGVSFNVYFVMNWRQGMQLFLGSPTARAVLFSALTTGTAFGSLAIARHPGTASMGIVLLLSLLAVLLSTFAFLPAMLYSIGLCQAPDKPH